MQKYPHNKLTTNSSKLQEAAASQLGYHSNIVYIEFNYGCSCAERKLIG